MQHQHTFKGPRHDLSQQFQIFFFFQFWMFRMLLNMDIINALSNLKFNYWVTSNYSVYLCVVLVYVLSNN